MTKHDMSKQKKLRFYYIYGKLYLENVCIVSELLSHIIITHILIKLYRVFALHVQDLLQVTPTFKKLEEFSRNKSKIDINVI